jgi:hypothetical protein
MFRTEFAGNAARCLSDVLQKAFHRQLDERIGVEPLAHYAVQQLGQPPREFAHVPEVRSITRPHTKW